MVLKCSENKVTQFLMQWLNVKKRLVVIGGKEYGAGSSEIEAKEQTVRYKSSNCRKFERIHRSNLFDEDYLYSLLMELITNLNWIELFTVTKLKNGIKPSEEVELESGNNGK